MRSIARVDLPGGKTVKFEPGGLHLMLFDLKQPLKPRDKLPLVLTIQGPDSSATMTTGNRMVPLGLWAASRCTADGISHDSAPVWPTPVLGWVIWT